MSKARPTASVILKRPPAPITRPMLLEALAPILELLGTDHEDVVSITVTSTRVRLQLAPRTRKGVKQLDQLLRVSYPVWEVGVDE